MLLSQGRKWIPPAQELHPQDLGLRGLERSPGAPGDPVLPGGWGCHRGTRQEQAEQVRMRGQLSNCSFIAKEVTAEKMTAECGTERAGERTACAVWCWAVVGQPDGIRRFAEEESDPVWFIWQQKCVCSVLRVHAAAPGGCSGLRQEVLSCAMGTVALQGSDND